jgi:hypothetical protein
LVKTHCPVEGHYLSLIPGSARDTSLKRLPTQLLPALYRDIREICAHYAGTVLRHRSGTPRHIAQV